MIPTEILNMTRKEIRSQFSWTAWDYAWTVDECHRMMAIETQVPDIEIDALFFLCLMILD